MKTCKVCGLSVTDGIAECPNCGSFVFEKRSGLKDVNIRLRKFK